MKILHVVDYLMPTMGYQEFLLPKWNARQGHDVYVLTSDRFYPVENYNQTWRKFLGERIVSEGETIISGVKVIRQKAIFELFSRPWIINLENRISKIKPDIIMVHGTTSFNSIRIARYCYKNNLPLLLDNHMVFSVVRKGLFSKMFYFFFKNYLKHKIEDACYKVIGVTDETCEYLNEVEGFDKNKIFYLPLGVDNEIFYPKKILPSNYFIVAQSGKLNNDKKPQWLADSVLSLLKKDKKIKLVYVGDGSSLIKKKIIDKFKNFGFTKNLLFLDFKNLKGLAEIYNKFNLFVFPDGTSLSALEVAACRKPVIMANYKASIFRSKQGVGVTYKVGDIEDLAIEIEKFMDNKQYYESVCSKSFNAIKKNFTYENISKNFIKICNEAILWNQKIK